MKKVVVMFVSAAALATLGMAAASNSMAASDNGSNDSAGIFVSGNLGYSNADYEKADFLPTPVSLKTSGFAWNANVGYQFNRYIAIEGGYTQFADVKASMDDGVPASDTVSLGAFGLNVKGMLPIANDRFDLFAKLGAMDMNEENTLAGSGLSKKQHAGSSWTPDLGVGAAYNVNKHIALSLQDVYTFKASFTKNQVKTSIPSTNSILAGVSYKFSV